MIEFDASISFKNKKMNFVFSTSSNKTVLFGKSGSGKSTILKMITGFFSPGKGEIKLKDKILFSSKKNINLPPNLRNLGYLPQEYTLFPNYSVKENILYGVKAKKLNVSEKELDRILDLLSIKDCIDKMPYDLSGGQQQRVALARVLLIKPDLLLLDEPFSALDMSIRQNLRDLVSDMTNEFNIPVLFVTHDFEDAYVFGEELIVIDSGNVLEFGEKTEIFNAPEYIETAKLLDFKNFWNFNEAASFMTLNNNIDKDTFICIRPENIMILREDLPKKKTLKGVQLEVVIKKIHKRGKYTHLVTKNSQNIKFIIHLPEHSFRKLNLFENKKIGILLKEESIVFCKQKAV